MDKQKKQQLLLGILIIIVLATIIILYFGYFKTPDITLTESVSLQQKSQFSEILIQNIKNNLEILDNPYFKNKVITHISLEKTGRSNPFLPF